MKALTGSLLKAYVERKLGRFVENYKKYEINTWPNFLCASHLGDPIGFYQNPEPNNIAIGIFQEGLLWVEYEKVVTIFYSEIISSEFPNGKKSEGINLILKGNKYVYMPVTGHQGKFYDSMLMMTFVNRMTLK